MSNAALSLLAAAALCLALAFLLLRWAGRNSLLDKTKDALWETVKARDTAAVRDHLGGTLGEITQESGTTARARKVAGMAAREGMARVATGLGWLFALAGLAAATLGVYWR